MNLKLVSSVGTSMSPSFTPKCPPTVFEFSVFPSIGGAKRYAVNGRQTRSTGTNSLPAANMSCIKFLLFEKRFNRLVVSSCFVQNYFYLCDLHDCSFVVLNN